MTSIRLSNEMEMRLAALCTTTKRSKSFYIKEALEHYLEDIADAYIALDRISNPRRQLLSTEEFIQAIESRE